MSTQVERLQALLQRVERNRAMPRAPRAPAAAQSAADSMKIRGTEETLLDLPPVMSQPAPAPAAAPAKPVAAAPAPAAARPAPSIAQRPAPVQEIAAPRTSRGAEQPVAAARPAPAAPSGEGRVLVDPTVESAGKPIAQVVSKHPPFDAPSFGDLLRRSLSARPR